MLSAEECKKRFISACVYLEGQKDAFSKLDGEFGDGDHGVTIGKIAAIIKTKFEMWDTQSPLKTLLDEIGMEVLSTDGGSACPLWGSFFMGMAQPLETQNYLDALNFAAMLRGGAEELKTVSGAKEGDKTLMDVVLPLAAKAEGFSQEGFLREAADCAKAGADATRNYAAKYGRAKNYGDKSLGYPDPGAVSFAAFFEGLAR